MVANPFDLMGKVALVTGGNSGLGLGFANGIARAGADVVVWGRRAEKNAEAATELREHGGRVLTQEIDVAEEEQVVRGIEEAVEKMGRLDCVVANAGIATEPTSFAELSAHEYNALLAVNQHGAFFTLREAVKHMIARAENGDPGGSLIVNGSLSVIAGVPRLEHYAAAKGALAAMTRGIAVECGRYGIRANMILPGRFPSALTDASNPLMVERLRHGEEAAAKMPIPRLGVPEDLQGIVVYLMSDASAYHTGDLITVDGGLSVTLA